MKPISAHFRAHFSRFVLRFRGALTVADHFASSLGKLTSVKVSKTSGTFAYWGASNNQVGEKYAEGLGHTTPYTSWVRNPLSAQFLDAFRLVHPPALLGSNAGRIWQDTTTITAADLAAVARSDTSSFEMSAFSIENSTENRPFQ